MTKVWTQLLIVNVAILLLTIILAVREWRKPSGRPRAFVPTILLVVSGIPGGLVHALGIDADDRISIAAQIAMVVLLVSAVATWFVYVFPRRNV